MAAWKRTAACSRGRRSTKPSSTAADGRIQASNLLTSTLLLHTDDQQSRHPLFKCSMHPVIQYIPFALSDEPESDTAQFSSPTLAHSASRLMRTERYLYSLTEAALADAAKPGQLEAVCSHQQMLCHGTIQIAPLQLLHTHTCTHVPHMSRAHNMHTCPAHTHMHTCSHSSLASTTSHSHVNVKPPQELSSRECKSIFVPVVSQCTPLSILPNQTRTLL